MKYLLSLLLLFASLSIAQVTQVPLVAGGSACTGSATIGYVATATANGASPTCTWQTVGGASVTNATLANAGYITDGGAANGITGTTTSTFPAAYAAGQAVWVKMNATNTGATTININSLGTKNVTKNGATVVAAGNLVTGQDYFLVYDGTQFQVLNFTILAADIPTLNQATTANAGTATALASTPTKCSAGTLPLGVAASGNAANCTATSQLFFGTAAPGSVSGNLPGDFFTDSTNHHIYWCNATSGTAAPACTSVGSGAWTQIDGSGSGTPGGSSGDIQVNNTGSFAGGRCTMDSSQNIICSGSYTAGSGAGVAGYFQCTQGTAPSNGTTAIQLGCPTSVTSYQIILAGAAGTGLPHYSNSSNVITETISAVNLASADVIGTLPAANLPNSGILTGDITTTFPAATVARVNGIAYSATAAAHSIEVITSANTTATAKVIPDCPDSGGNHINFTQSGDSFSCGSTSSGGGSTGTSITSITPITVNTNTTSDQQLMELSLSAGYLNSAKQPFLFNGAGVYTTQTAQTPTIDLKIKLCTVSGCGSGTVVTLVNIVSTATIAAVTNNNWNLSAMGYTATTGSTGNLEIHGPLSVDLGALTSTADSIFNDVNAAVTGNIDLTAALYVDFTVAFSTNAVTANIFTQRQGGIMPFSATAAPVTSVFGQTGTVVAPAALGASTATTQSADDNSTKVATTAYVDRMKNRTIGCSVGDPGNSGALTTSSVCYFSPTFACTISSYTLMIDAGTVTVKFWKIATGTAIPTISNSISTSGVSISTGTVIHSSTVSDFTSTAVTANDILAIQPTAIGTAKWLTAEVGCDQ